jgi:hypothetical protein
VRLAEADGTECFFVDKVPIFTRINFSAATRFPVPVGIRCEVIEIVDDGQVLVVSTAHDGVATVEGRTRFRVRADHVIDTRFRNGVAFIGPPGRQPGQTIVPAPTIT